MGYRVRTCGVGWTGQVGGASVPAQWERAMDRLTSSYDTGAAESSNKLKEELTLPPSSIASACQLGHLEGVCYSPQVTRPVFSFKPVNRHMLLAINVWKCYW